jgi:hypothetical protein
MMMRYLGGAVGHMSKPADLALFELTDTNLYTSPPVDDEWLTRMEGEERAINELRDLTASDDDEFPEKLA